MIVKLVERNQEVYNQEKLCVSMGYNKILKRIYKIKIL